MLHQGNNFYQQLMDYLLRLDQTIKDFVTSRNLEKNDMNSGFSMKSAEVKKKN